MATRQRASVVVVGGGIVGVSTAYFLAKRGARDVVLVEQTRIGAAASGKAGGFLAAGWAGGASDALHRAGFALHADLAKDLRLESYRALPTMQVGHRKSKAKTSGSGGGTGVLLDEAVTHATVMDADTAQVTPLELVSKLWAAAEAQGARLVVAKATGLAVAATSTSTSTSAEAAGGPGPKPGPAVLSLDDGTCIEADKVVLAMGPWTVAAEDWLPELTVPMVGIASSSLIVTPAVEGTAVAATCCFCAEDASGCNLELYPRPDNTVYVCGIGGSPHLGKKALLETHPDRVPGNTARLPLAAEAFARIAAPGIMQGDAGAAAVSPGAAVTLGVQAGGDGGGALPSNVASSCCLRPCAPDAMPIIGEAPGHAKRVFIATAHNCWGILLVR